MNSSHCFKVNFDKKLYLLSVFFFSTGTHITDKEFKDTCHLHV